MDNSFTLHRLSQENTPGQRLQVQRRSSVSSIRYALYHLMRRGRDSIMHPSRYNMGWSSTKVDTSYMMSNGEEYSAMVRIIEPTYPMRTPSIRQMGAMVATAASISHWMKQAGCTQTSIMARQ